MADDNCFLDLKALFKDGEMSDGEIRDAIEAIRDIQKIEGSNYYKRALEMIERQEINSKAAANRDINTRLKVKDNMAVANAMGVGSQAALEARMSGQAKGGLGANDSWDRISAFRSHELINPVDKVVTEMNLDAAYIRSPEFGLMLLQEKWAIRDGAIKSVTNNSAAFNLAKAMDGGYGRKRDLFALHDKAIGFVDYYTGMRRYGKDKVGKWGKELFARDLLTSADNAKTFPIEFTYEAKLNRAKEMYSHIMKGDAGDPTKNRSIFFSSPEKEHSFMQKYSVFDNPMDAYQAEMRGAARNLGAMDVFGPNPKLGFKLLADKVDPSESTSRAEAMYADLSGALLDLNQTTAATAMVKGGKIARGLMSLKLLSNAAISAFAPDLINSSSFIASMGDKKLFEGLQDTVLAYAHMLPREKRGRIIDSMMLAHHAIMMPFADAMTEEVPGVISRFTAEMFKWTGLRDHTQIMHAVTSLNAGKMLHEYSGSELGTLPPKLQNFFTRYQIGPKEWDIIRTGVDELDGIKVITPAAILKLKGERQPIEKAFAKYATMMNDAAKSVTLESDAFSRSIFHNGLKEDHVVGQLMQYIGQFKQSPIQAGRLQKRIVQSEITPGNRAAAFAQNFALLTLAGYLTYQAKEVLVKGHTPEWTNDPKRWGAVFMDSVNRGGAFAPFGDYLGAEYNKKYRSIALDFLGPVAGELNTAAALGASAVRGEIKPIKQEAISFAASHVPGANTAFIKPILESMILFKIKEMATAGNFARQKAKLRPRGQEFILPNTVK